MDSESVRSIYEQYPWASEKTLEDALKHAGDRNQNLKRIVKQQLDVDLDELADAMELSASKLSKISSYAKTIEDDTKKFISSLDRVDDPLTGAAAMMELGARAIDGTVGGLGALAGKLPLMGKVVGALGTVTGKTALVAAGTAAMFAKIASQQDKVIRSMIDMGYVTSNLDQYTDIRGFVSSFGMTIEEFIGSTADLNGMFANNEKGIMQGVGGFAEFLMQARNLAKDGVFPSYGYSPKELATRLIEEAEQLYMLGEIDQLDADAKVKIIENFKKSTETANYLGSQMSEQRSALLRARDEISENLSFRRALMVNSEELTDVYGENYETLLRERIAIVDSMNQSIFGKGEFSDNIINSFNNFLGNFQFDQTMINDIDPALRLMLNRLGALPEFTKLTETLEKADASPQELIQAQNDFITALAENAVGQRALTSEERAIQSQAQAMLNLLPRADTQYQSNLTDSLRLMQETNSESIQVEGEAQIAYAQLRDTLEPGFTTVAGGLQGFSAALRESVNVMGEIFGIDTLKYTTSQTKQQVPDDVMSTIDGDDILFQQDVLGAAKDVQYGMGIEGYNEAYRSRQRIAAENAKRKLNEENAKRKLNEGQGVTAPTTPVTPAPVMPSDASAVISAQTAEQLNHSLLSHSLVGNSTGRLSLISNIFKFSKKYGIDPALAIAIAEKESAFKINALGDKHLRHKAHGAFQMRRPALQEVFNRYGIRFTEQDMYDPAKAAQAGILYMAAQRDFYGARTNTDIARMYNGGPKGKFKSATLSYGNSVAQKQRRIQSKLNSDPITMAEINSLEAEISEISGSIANTLQTENLQEIQHGG